MMVCRLGKCAKCHKHRIVFRHNRPMNGMMFRDHCYLCRECHPDKHEVKGWLRYVQDNEIDCCKPVYA